MKKEKDHHQQQQLDHLPADAMALVLAKLPLQERLGSCSLACRSMSAAAVAATHELALTLRDQQHADAAWAWLRARGCKLLKGLRLSAQVYYPGRWHRPLVTVDLPWADFTQLRSLALFHVELLPMMHTAGGHCERQAVQTVGSGSGALSAAAAGGAAERAVFAALTALTSLELVNCSAVTSCISDNAWMAHHLAHLTALRKLRVASLQVHRPTLPASTTNSAAAAPSFSTLLPQLTALTSLCLSYLRLKSSDFAALSSLTQLQQLRLSMCNASADHPLRLKDLPGSVTSLGVDNCYISSPPASASSSSSSSWQHTRLRELSIECSTGFPAAAIRLMPNLSKLILDSGRGCWNGGIAASGIVAKLPEALGALPQLQQLRHIELRSMDHYTNADSFAALTSSSHLEEVKLTDSRVPEGALQHMFGWGQQLQQLRALEVGCNDTWIAVDAKWYRPDMHEQYEEELQMSSLVVAACDLGWLPSSCPGLQRLSLLWMDASSSDSDAEVLQLLQLTALTALGLGGNGWDDWSAGTVLAQMTGLQQLTVLRACKLSLTGLAALTALTGLQRLLVAGCQSYFHPTFDEIGSYDDSGVDRASTDDEDDPWLLDLNTTAAGAGRGVSAQLRALCSAPAALALAAYRAREQLWESEGY